jgi:hypothetical protein
MTDLMLGVRFVILMCSENLTVQQKVADPWIGPFGLRWWWLRRLRWCRTTSTGPFPTILCHVADDHTKSNIEL